MFWYSFLLKHLRLPKKLSLQVNFLQMQKFYEQAENFSGNGNILWSNTKFLMQTKVLQAGEHRSFSGEWKTLVSKRKVSGANAKVL